MRWPARSIWDTRIQCVCGVISARGEAGVEIYMSGTFGQIGLSPPRVVINPNRLYPIEPAVRAAGRFAISVVAPTQKAGVVRLIHVRRREVDKAAAVGLRVLEDHHGIPYIDGAMRTIFCEVERICATGDHTLVVGRVIESRVNPTSAGGRPLLYPEVAGDTTPPSVLVRAIRTALRASGALDLLKSALYRRRPPPPANIALETYRNGGQTEQEIAEILKYGILDRGRSLSPPRAPHIVTRRLGVCVVGTGWGAFHCELVRKAAPSAELYVCGRNPDRTRHLAHAVNAKGMFLSLEEALADRRVQALTLALPHDFHREAAARVAAAGKHALVEKPIATTLSDADAMIEGAARAKTILMVAEDMHFRPAVREAACRIARGDVGEPLYMLVRAGGIRRPQGWAADKQRMGGGVLIDIGVHYVRALRLLMGEPSHVVATRAMQVDTKTEGEDSVQLLFSSTLGWEAHMLLSWVTMRGHVPDITVAGDKGTLHVWPGSRSLDYYAATVRGEDPIESLMTRLMPRRSQRRERPRRILVPGQDQTGYEAEMREFLSAVIEERQPASLPEDARRDLEIVLCGYEALARGARVSIPFVAPIDETRKR
jgi:predicted dehydrogenase/flavin reductase (DIM6/NTAB) family NADH-FMN oxidoreductase RutF